MQIWKETGVKRLVVNLYYFTMRDVIMRGVKILTASMIEGVRLFDLGTN